MTRHSAPRILATLLLAFGLLSGAAAGVLLWLDPPHAIMLHVRWAPNVDTAMRAALEQQLRLSDGTVTDGNTWRYSLSESSTDAIRAIVQHPLAEDTAHINRARFRPELAQDRGRRAMYYGAVLGCLGTLRVLAWLLAKA